MELFYKFIRGRELDWMQLQKPQAVAAGEREEADYILTIDVKCCEPPLPSFKKFSTTQGWQIFTWQQRELWVLTM